jgi:hypothetical protein
MEASGRSIGDCAQTQDELIEIITNWEFDAGSQSSITANCRCQGVLPEQGARGQRAIHERPSWTHVDSTI